MISFRSGIFLGVVLCVGVTNGFLFGNKKDCLISNWSKWSQPFGFGAVSRERKVLRYPTNGGSSCPSDLLETKLTNSKPTIQKTASDVVDHFVSRQGSIQGGRSVGQLRDLLIIVDSSGSITSSGFSIAKTQLAELLGLLCPVTDPFKGYQQAALIEYSSNVVDVFDFNDKSNTFQIQTAIKNMKYFGSSTCTATAFKQGKNMFQTSRGMRTRPDVKQEVLIITDGRSNCGGDAIAAAKDLHKTAEVYGLMIGINSSVGKAELLQYVSAPINTHLFAVASYQDLAKLVQLVKTKLSQPGQGLCAPFDI